MSAAFTVRLDRDSVCAGDDTDPHGRPFPFEPTASIGELLAAIRDAGYLASITGGEATWLVDCGADRSVCIGVVAQQWARPRLTLPEDLPLASLFRDKAPRLHFRYWCQADPIQVFLSIAGGTALPSRYGTRS